MALTDLLTLAEAKLALDIDSEDTSQDVSLQYYVTAASRTLDGMEHAGPIVQRTVEDERILHRNVSGHRLTRVRTRLAPVVSFSSVVEWRDGEQTVCSEELSTTAPPNEGYLAYRWQNESHLYSGRLERRVAGITTVWDGDVVVTYVAGRFADTASVPDLWKRACSYVLDNMWRDREPGTEQLGEYTVPRSSFPTFAIPNIVPMMLADEWQGPSGVS